MSDLNTWLKDVALPLWWDAGASRDVGGFHEVMGLDGKPVLKPRRARVIGRQIYVYASAAQAGIPGPWREAAEHGLDFMVSRFMRPDGLIRALLDAEGEPVGDAVILYDQAFCLFGLAAAAGAGIEPDAQHDRAQRLLGVLESSWRLPAGGFIEHEDERYQANPHMHLLEASLAWEAVTGDAAWTRLADELAELALAKFIDREKGFLREFFTADWAPAAGKAGRWIEPGHLFEWAWLMMRWAKLRGRADGEAAARRLHDVGVAHGIDAERGVAIDAILDDWSIASNQARLWPQTERMKAAGILAQYASTDDERAGYVAEVHAAVAGLSKYLAMPVPGTWADKMLPDGSFVPEPAPASSLYHIACAILDVTARGIHV